MLLDTLVQYTVPVISRLQGNYWWRTGRLSRSHDFITLRCVFVFIVESCSVLLCRPAVTALLSLALSLNLNLILSMLSDLMAVTQMCSG